MKGFAYMSAMSFAFQKLKSFPESLMVGYHFQGDFLRKWTVLCESFSLLVYDQMLRVHGFLFVVLCLEGFLGFSVVVSVVQLKGGRSLFPSCIVSLHARRLN